MPGTHSIEAARRRYEEPEMQIESIGRATAWFLVVAALLMLLAVPVWRATEDDTFPGAALLNGWDRAKDAGGLVQANREALAAIHQFEEKLEDGSPLLGATLTKVQGLQLHFGGKGNETVYPGARDSKGDWLLLRTGYDHLVGKPFLDPSVLEARRRSADSWCPEPSPDPRPALLDFHRQLKARGIDLLLLPVPTKPAVESASLASDIPRPLANASYEAFVAEMEDAGIRVFDVATLLQELTATGTAAYLRTDSHWSPAAVSRVAESLATWLEETYGDELGPADTLWQSTPTIRTGRGDLWRLLKLSEERPLYEEESVDANEITSWDGKLWSPAPDARVLVLGDSFVNVFSDESLHWGRAAGFAEQLSAQLTRGVDRIARNNGSSDQVRKDLARSPERLHGKRVVVYQFATRELSVGDWPITDLNAAE